MLSRPQVLSYLVSSTYRREGEEGLTLEGAGNVPASITEAMRERLLGAGVLQALLRLWPSLQLAQVRSFPTFILTTLGWQRLQSAPESHIEAQS